MSKFVVTGLNELTNWLSQGVTQGNDEFLCLSADMHLEAESMGYKSTYIGHDFDTLEIENLHLSSKYDSDKFDYYSDVLRKKFLGPNYGGRGWDEKEIYDFLVSTRFLKAATKNLRKIKEEAYFCFYLNAQDLYFNSRFKTSLILNVFKNTKNNLKFVKSEAYPFEQNRFKHIPKLKINEPTILIHAPACWYTANDLKALLLKNLDQKKIRNIPSTYFNVPIFPEFSAVMEDLSSLREVKNIGLYREAFRKFAYEFLQSNFLDLDKDVISLQVDRWWDRKAYQVIFMSHLLNNVTLKEKNIELFISDIDTGLYGPLITYALNHGHEITTIPHSGKIMQSYFNNFTTPISIVKKRVVGLKLLVILNSLDGLAGLGLQNPQSLICALGKLSDLCLTNGVELRVRSKPRIRTDLITRELGLIEIDDYESAIAWPTRVLSLGQPTTLIQKFLGNGIEVDVITSGWSSGYMSMVEGVTNLIIDASLTDGVETYFKLKPWQKDSVH